MRDVQDSKISPSFSCMYTHQLTVQPVQYLASHQIDAEWCSLLFSLLHASPFLDYFQVGHIPVCSPDQGQATRVYQSQTRATLLM